MVGYAEDHAPDCFTFFYMKTRKIIPSRGMIWTEGLNCKESDAEIQEIEDESETEDLVFRPYSTTKQSNEENLTRDMESGEATEEKIIPSIDQQPNLLTVNESLEAVTVPVTFERAVQESKWKDAMIKEFIAIVTVLDRCTDSSPIADNDTTPSGPLVMLSIIHLASTTPYRFSYNTSKE